ncbi:MAG TPA: sigma-70 family RNA polymerase sigma factor [Gemmataceae bacterium]|nr:sigma-70 family RNA polymerase sigma factor [Gemmataceae bacterium]
MSRELSNSSLDEMLTRFHSGDERALDELIRRLGDRLDRLARKMLRGFPLVRAREGSDDVLQSALVRLTRSLRQVRPASTADFFRLAAAQIRRELLDLARYHRRRLPVNPITSAAEPNGAGPPPFDPPDNHAEATNMERWEALHEAVERLPDEAREVFGLTFYHGWTQQQIADVLGVSERQVRRRWRDACLRLNDLLDGELPSP